MTLYGDLDISVIDDMPPEDACSDGPLPCIQKKRGIHFYAGADQEGRQVYIVYPLIAESEKLDYENLETGIVISPQRSCPLYSVPWYTASKSRRQGFDMNMFVRKGPDTDRHLGHRSGR